MLDIEQVGLREDGTFVDGDEREIELVFKLYPWEWMFREAFGARLKGSSTRWIEPPWKAILSNKGILPLLWAMFPESPEPAAGLLRGRSQRHAAWRILCAQADLLARGRQRHAGLGRRGAGAARRAPTAPRASSARQLAPLPNFSDQYPVLGSWIVDGAPCGLSIREDENPITGNTSRFIPHAIV